MKKTILEIFDTGEQVGMHADGKMHDIMQGVAQYIAGASKEHNIPVRKITLAIQEMAEYVYEKHYKEI